MSVKWPSPPSGTGLEAVWMRQLLACCKACLILSGVGYKISRQDIGKGTILKIEAGDGGPQPSPIQPFIITTLHNANYFSARPYNFTTKMASGSVVTVAKCLNGRRANIDNIDGNVVVYSYSPMPSQENIRSAQIVGIVSQWQVMSPRYVADDGTGMVGNIIFAAIIQGGSGVKDGAGVPIKFCEIQPDRRWAYQYGQSGSLP